jgi:hypothetical protein
MHTNTAYLAMIACGDPGLALAGLAFDLVEIP